LPGWDAGDDPSRSASIVTGFEPRTRSTFGFRKGASVNSDVQTTSGCRVLIVEDDYLLAEELARGLSGMGLRIQGPVSDIASALRILQQSGSVDVAVVDINLRGNMAYPISLELERQGVPFLFATAYAASAVPARFASAPRIGKPYSIREVAAAIARIARIETPASAAFPSHRGLSDNPLIRRLLVANELGLEDREFLQRVSAQTRLVGARNEISSEGDRSSYLRLVMNGIAARSRTLRDGRRSIISFLIPGDLCDFHVTILDRMDHSIVAITDCAIVDIGKDAVSELSRRPNIHRALLWSSLVDQAILRDWIVNLGSRSGEERVAHFLCEWVARMDAIDHTNNGSCDFPLTQEHLAEALGMSAVHANRSLQGIRRRGLIALRDRTLTVLDWPKLASFGEFEPSYLHRGRKVA
jgi:CRP-like cAMP-binding protein/ActR/RegA family two-component response regulator